MRTDWSWDSPAQQYLSLYRACMAERTHADPVTMAHVPDART
jgi:hypothetical protein